MDTFQKIFNREENAAGNIEFLREVTERYPYFGPARLYALKEHREDPVAAEQLAAKASLFFTDPFLLKQQVWVADDNPAEIIPQEEIKEEVPVIIKPEEEMKAITENITAAADPEESVAEDDSRRSNDLAVEQYAQQQADKEQQPAPRPADEIIFEPLHASDYFASQGIKLSDDALGNDKLGLQLKSFTAWLKTMKKVHSDRLPPVTAAGEAAVQNMAEKSNIEEDVITEAMAEVYAQQGKADKAIETYTKLSLINPSKSAYFAAKIESLK